MTYVSVCSGIEAATVAWHPLGWTPVAFSEIDRFPSAVLAHHYPDVPNWGDMTKCQEWPDANVDVLVGGTPCQSFSVAGLRAGLDDPRGALLLVYLAIARRYRPRWLVWENVPGVLSADNGRAFGSLLGGLAELGYGFAYRVLDAQYFGVAQRRRRVFVVGHLGDWRRAAAVLFERESLSGHPAPCRGEGQVAPTVPARRTGGGGLGTDFDCDGGLIPEVANPLTARMHKGVNTTCDEGQTMIAHALRADGFDASEDGTGRGTPLVPCAPAIAFHNRQDPDISGAVTHPLGAQDNGMAILMSDTLYNKGISHASTQKTHAGSLLRALSEEVGAEAFTQWGLGILDSLLPAEVLQSALHGLGLRRATFSRRWLVYHALSRQEAHSEGLVRAMREAECEGCASQGWRPPEQLARELGAYLSELSQPGAQATRFLRDLWQASEGLGLLREALSAVQEVGRPSRGESESAPGGLQVRRLTVEECEFLQGFPRNYTLIPYRGQLAADGPRYKALGNSMAVPVMRWIGTRMTQVEAL